MSRHGRVAIAFSNAKSRNLSLKEQPANALKAYNASTIRHLGVGKAVFTAYHGDSSQSVARKVSEEPLEHLC